MPQIKTPLIDFLDAFRRSPTHGVQLVDDTLAPGRPASWASEPLPLTASVRRLLPAIGVTRLYTHQAQALAAINAGRGTVVATPTSSGKTLVYQLAMLTTAVQAPDARGLFLFPLKALAQDQLNSFGRLAAALKLSSPS